MCRVAWLVCAFLALAHGRVYERCELARDLQALGVNPDDISTWVCIAYHESRFDTAANNPYSGDHGIFQISELYWCGPGKACRLPCSALRDEDISNDLECALQVHEEHTRLQGNGFLAWVVYPQHCKHNTKKYLVDCDTSVKSSIPITKSRTFEQRYYPKIYNYVNNVEDLPSYLVIGNIFRGSYGKVLNHDAERIDWYKYKYDNVDDLKIPSAYIKPLQPTEPSITTFTTTSQTTTSAYIPPVKPWRTIETNQFRKKQLLDKNTVKPTSLKDLSFVTSIPKQITPSIQTTVQPPIVTITTTYAPIYDPVNTSTLITTSSGPYTQTSTERTTTTRPITKIIVPSPATASNTERHQPITIPSSFTFLSTPKPTLSTIANLTSVVVTTKRPSISTARSRSWTTATIPSTTTVSTPRLRWNTGRPNSALSTTARPPRSSSTTFKPFVTGRTTIIPAITERTAITLRTTARTLPSTTTHTSYDANAFQKTTKKPKSEFSWYTFTSRTSITPATTKSQSTTTTTSRPEFQSTFPTTTSRPKFQSAFSTTTSRPKFQSAFSTTTSRPKFQTAFSTTMSSPKLQSVFSTTTSQPSSTTTTSRPQTTKKPRTTQSIFDLYLNPTKPPKLPTYKFNSLPQSRFRLKIFDSGTTTPATPKHTSGKTNSQIKRHNLYNSHY